MRNSKNSVEVFDSLGVDQEKENTLKLYCKFKVNHLIVNETAFQSTTTNTCGEFCLYFIINRYENCIIKEKKLFLSLYVKGSQGQLLELQLLKSQLKNNSLFILLKVKLT